jgi:hypothetical protein
MISFMTQAPAYYIVLSNNVVKSFILHALAEISGTELAGLELL